MQQLPHSGHKLSNVCFHKPVTWNRVDFTRRVLVVTKTKSGKDREIPMNPEVLKTLFALQSRSDGHEFVFVNPNSE